MKPLPAGVAHDLAQGLAECDAGDVRSCEWTSQELYNHDRFRESVAVADHGCHTPMKSAGRACTMYDHGEMCDASVCEKCKDLEPPRPKECIHYDEAVCSDRLARCQFDTLAACVRFEQARTCLTGASAMAHWGTTANVSNRCNDDQVQKYEVAKGYIDEACQIAKKSPFNPDPNPNSFCDTNNVDAVLADCAKSRKEMADWRAYQAQQRMQAFQSMQAAMSRFHGGGSASIPEFKPSMPADASLPEAFVNPLSGATWSSENLAFVASLLPEGVLKTVVKSASKITKTVEAGH